MRHFRHFALLAVCGAALAFHGADAFAFAPAGSSLASARAGARGVQRVQQRFAVASSGPLYSSAAESVPEPLRDAASEAVGVAKEAVTAVEKAAGVNQPTKLQSTLKTGSYFFLWYLFNIGYNIYNKRALNILPLPWIVGSMQMGIGILYVLPLWLSGLRKAPKLAKGSLKPLSLLAFLHMLAHITAVLSLNAGAVSFTHIVKACEPVFTALFSALILGQVFAPAVYASLLPVVTGVALASMKELSFSWIAFGNAMGSNTASALRGIMGKKQMNAPKGENMNAPNLYAVLTILAFAMLTPLALIFEGAKAKGLWSAAMAMQGVTSKSLSLTVLLSGLFYYLYNEVAFLALDSVHPVTHAVGNTIKRVVIIVSSVIVFRTQMSPLSIVGSSIAIAGTLLYSLVKQAYDKKDKK